MKTIVYFADGSIEATANHAKLVSAGVARYATPDEVQSYEAAFERDDRERIYEDCES